MKSRSRRVVQFPIIILATVLTIVMTPGAAVAANPVLWQCQPFGGGINYACTKITSAPAGGVQVLDRNSGIIYTLYNGNSVALWGWSIDNSGHCGVAGNPYVWSIVWQNAGNHYAYIGDHYLKTGDVEDWNDFIDHRGNLGNEAHNQGYGNSGTCDVYYPAK